MRAVSERFLAAIDTSHAAASTITCTVPGGDPVQIGKSAKLPNGRRGPGWTSASVSASASTGTRYTASLDIVPAPGFNTYEMVATPGAIFGIEAGVDYGAGDVELVPCGVFELASAPSHNILDGNISLTLADLWQRVERSRFTDPYAPLAGTRAASIAAAVVAAVPGVTVITTATDAGTINGTGVWDRDRTEFINDLARDGSLDVAFDGAGAFVIRDEPILDQAASVALYRTGPGSNIVTAGRSRPFDRMYNTVVVVPFDESQTWTRQTISLTGPNHPRHPDKIGVVPYFYASPTLTTAARAVAAGSTILQRVLGSTETVSLDVLGNPAHEIGDVITIVHDETDTDPGFEAAHIIDGWTFSLADGSMSLSTRSDTLADLEEAA